VSGPFGTGGSERELLAHDLCRCLEKVLKQKRYDRHDSEYRHALRAAAEVAEAGGVPWEELQDLHVRTGGCGGTVQDDSLWRRVAPPEMLVREVMES